jgi:hypothetical protein
MKTPRPRALPAALALASALGLGIAGPHATAAREPGLWLAQAGRLTLEQAVGRVQQATGGRVLDARDEGNVYRIKVLTPRGEVRVVLVDPRTGAMR